MDPPKTAKIAIINPAIGSPVCCIGIVVAFTVVGYAEVLRSVEGLLGVTGVIGVTGVEFIVNKPIP